MAPKSVDMGSGGSVLAPRAALAKSLRRPEARKVVARNLLALSLLLGGCATVRDPLGLAFEQGRVPEVSVPKALRADLEIQPLSRDAGSFTIRLYAEPYRRYRVEAFAFPGVRAASYLWNEGKWILLLPSRREAVQGTGDTLDLGQGIRLPEVQAALGFLWGDPLPDFSHRADSSLTWSGDTLRWTARGIPWRARFDRRTGACLEAFSPQYHLSYGRLRRWGRRVVPAQAEIAVDGTPAWILRVHSIEEVAAWKKDPFTLSVPAGYSVRGPEP